MESSLAAAAIVHERYRLQHEIGRGGMGSLWLALDTTLMRQVALKFLSPVAADDRKLRARFEREARAAAQVRSPYVVEMYDYGIDQGRAFIVMEYLEGEDLRARLEREGALPITQAAAIAQQVGKALDAIHAAEVVHRDMKPGNIVIAPAGADEEIVKIVDFGVAKVSAAFGGKLTATGMMIGTFKYMSPEQARSPRVVDHRADLWSTAAILYKVLTGRAPFLGASTADLVDRICRSAFPCPTVLAPELPPALDAFFARAFARDIDARFQSGRELAEAFCAALDVPVIASDRLPSSALARSGPRLRVQVSAVEPAPKSGVSRSWADSAGGAGCGQTAAAPPSALRASLSDESPEPATPTTTLRSGVRASPAAGGMEPTRLEPAGQRARSEAWGPLRRRLPLLALVVLVSSVVLAALWCAAVLASCTTAPVSG